MILIFSIWLILVLVFSFWKLKWGVALFLVYMVLVPYMKLQIGGHELGQNLFNFAFLASYFFYAKKNKIKTNLIPLAPFVFYFISTLCIMPFQSHVPFGYMLNAWRVDIMSTLILPFVMWNVAKNDASAVVLFRNAILFSIVIAVGYGLFLILLGGINPYIMYISTFMDVEQDVEKYFAAEGEGRLFGRISSVFMHPMSYALFLGLSLIYVIQCFRYVKKNICFILIFAITISAITCGVRSVLGGLVVAALFFFIKNKNKQIAIGIIITAFLGYLIINIIPELSDYLGSIFDVKGDKSEVKGSSFEMRLTQLEGAIDESKKSPLFGLGYGWTGYYQSLKGAHPICLAFESLIYVIICNFGIVGFFIWIFMILKYLKINRLMHLNDNILFDCMMIFYLAYSCITGEYGYMKLFLIFYILMLCNQLQSPDNKAKY